MAATVAVACCETHGFNSGNSPTVSRLGTSMVRLMVSSVHEACMRTNEHYLLAFIGVCDVPNQRAKGSLWFVPCHYVTSKEVDTQLNQEIFQRDNSISNQSAPSFDQLFELNELKVQSQEKDMVIKDVEKELKSLSGNMDKDKIKQDLEEIETINIELDHREKVLVITTLKDELRKLKGKDLANNEVTHHPSDPEINTEPITPKLLNKRSAHSAYIKHTQEEVAVLRDLVDHI
ncbi:hypothetical protein Tco_0672633 [Tanacetum coccineum]